MIKKLTNTKLVYDLTLECEHEIETPPTIQEISDKINEIIDYINKEDK